MPYRRLPNTDNSRYRALKKALELGNHIAPFKLAFSQATFHKVKSFTTQFELLLNTYRETYSNQVKRSKDYNELYKKAKLYISHFIQVMNFAIARGELPASSRSYFGIAENDSKVPLLNSEAEVIAWGEKLVKGDSERVSKGGNYITNPTVGNVKVRYDKFMESYWKQKSLQGTSGTSLGRVAGIREEADQIILNVWNEVEEYYKDLPEAERKSKCEEYGLVYVFRPSEKLKHDAMKNQTEIVFEQEIMENTNLAEDRMKKLEQTQYQNTTDKKNTNMPLLIIN
ncbi:MAG: hypothetical protein HY958_04895 [Bacteroidia bacterium]|nr:hypothetical protein [Bacteroidia bacterium]